MTAEAHIKQSMDRMYRLTRHVYDASRKYFLLGRDRLIDNLNAREDERVIEIGCGTARNLIKMARAYPQASFYGFDASDEMLKTAGKSLVSKGLHDNVQITQAFAQNFDPGRIFNMPEPPDKLVYSYTLSMIPPWQEAIDHGLRTVRPGGELHIVDFHTMEERPLWFRKLMFWWLDLFHVYPRPEILVYLRQLQDEGHGKVEIEELYGGYAYRAVFTKSN